MMLTPGPVPLRHISTPAKMVEVLRVLCSLDIPDALLKVACCMGRIHVQPASSPDCAAKLLQAACTGLGGWSAQ